MDKTLFEIGGRTLPLTNLDKVYWLEEGLVKADLIGYYVSIAPHLLPQLKDRPVVLTRYPDGIHGKAFFQKDRPNPTPDWVRTHPIYHKDVQKTANYILVDEPATLAFIANLGCIELHAWQSRIAALDYPDYAVIDLDPAEGATWNDVVLVAMLCREVLAQLGLRGYAKTTGASGLHIFIPTSGLSFPEIQLCVEFIGRVVRDSYPEKVTLERVIQKRSGKVYVDYLQNTKGKTMVSVFSVRPRPGGTVSFPVSWDLLKSVTPASFTMANAVSSLHTYGNSFAGMLEDRQDLGPLLETARAINPGAGISAANHGLKEETTRPPLA